ncbi:hypothetical protein E2C01_013938 [Portunus trituberculatus]|uniref:Uncharacterized protein n=1 Tax=Portunus trituberculatus TaxID=210409 RepID=A0A5B7DHX8_PORTR|nr:hypothetical protein [Portunus trituberculatus]
MTILSEKIRLSCVGCESCDTTTRRWLDVEAINFCQPPLPLSMPFTQPISKHPLLDSNQRGDEFQAVMAEAWQSNPLPNK